MNDTAVHQVAGRRARLIAPTQSARYFYSVAATIVLIITFAGFRPFYLAGEGMGGRKIAPALFPLVVVHGTLMTAWVILFFVQSLLISTRRRRLHMKLGWAVALVACGVAITGFEVAVQSVRLSPDGPFWGMAYRQFLLVMLAEVTLFAMFVLAGVLLRKRPQVHRAMMLLASLSILAGATVRMPILFPIFGVAGWMGIFGPIFTLGAGFLLARSLLTRGLDRWLAAGYATMVAFYVAACQLAESDAWSQLARALFNT